MNFIETIKLNNRQKAIGVIILFPWYLYFAPKIINFLLNLYLVYFGSNIDINGLNVIYNLVVGIVVAIPLFLVFKNFIYENFRVFKNNLTENIIWVVTIGLLVSYGLSFVGEMIQNLLLQTSDSEATNQVLVEALVQSNFALMFIQTVIIAPFVEEMLFRGLIFNSLRQKNIILAHIVSAFLFGLLHVYSYILAGDMSEWIKLIPYMTVGFSLSFAYEKRQTIFAPILLHSLKNCIAVLLLALMY
ncbi:CPBP family intramembrane glutamic endopeptidase [Thomasclavelia sp.]|uniref:CPBP family intramembrane glutamic endopeptidase n=1 Tax=Thomasclavelia sp. TaxID=3025757 RepID=UPI0025E9FF62|nr:type II CAAX endopeptidase family protein [Thomasclavelia sp.]